MTAGEVQEPSHVRNRTSGPDDLDHVCAGGGHPGMKPVEIAGQPLEVVRGDHEAPAGLRRDHVVESRVELHVHQVDAPVDRLLQDPSTTFGVGVGPAPSFGLGAAGEKKGLCPGAEKGGNVQVTDEVGTHLEEVRHGRELRHPGERRLGIRLGQAHADCGHVSSRFQKHESLSRFSEEALSPESASPGNPLNLRRSPRGPPLRVPVVMKRGPPTAHDPATRGVSIRAGVQGHVESSRRTTLKDRGDAVNQHPDSERVLERLVGEDSRRGEGTAQVGTPRRGSRAPRLDPPPPPPPAPPPDGSSN